MPIPTKFGRMSSYLDGPLPIKSHDPLFTQFCEITWRTQIIIPSLQQDGDIPWETPSRKGILSFDHVILQHHMRNNNHYISTSTRPWATKLNRLATYLEGFLLREFLDSLVTWSSNIILQTKSIIFPLPQWLWSPTMARWWLTLGGSHSYSDMSIWLHALPRSRDKLKPLYLHNNSAFCHHTC